MPEGDMYLEKKKETSKLDIQIVWDLEDKNLRNDGSWKSQKEVTFTLWKMNITGYLQKILSKINKRRTMHIIILAL